MKPAIYVRVSTVDQSLDNQLDDLKKYIQQRGWEEAVVYSDHGVSGAKDRRPALDDLLKAARRRQIDVVVCWRLDRFGRSLRHLLNVLQELEALGVGFISLNEGLDATTPAGRLQMHLLGAFAEFERARIQERVRAGLARARRQGKRLGPHRAELPAASCSLPMVCRCGPQRGNLACLRPTCIEHDALSPKAPLRAIIPNPQSASKGGSPGSRQLFLEGDDGLRPRSGQSVTVASRTTGPPGHVRSDSHSAGRSITHWFALVALMSPIEFFTGKLGPRRPFGVPLRVRF